MNLPCAVSEEWGVLTFRGVLKSIGIGGRELKAAPLRGRVPMPIGLGSGTSSGGSIPFWGTGVDGYDSLLSGAFDYEAAIGRYSDNSAVAACLSFIISAFCSTTLQVGTKNGTEYTPDASHPLLDLLAKPHADYDGDWLMALLLADYWNPGNHYWNIVRSGTTGPPVEIQPMLGSLTRPIKLMQDEARLLDHYRYQPNGMVQDVPAEKVLHFKYSIPDPADMRLGLPPLAPARREVYADNKASEVAAAILRKPQPSGFLMPESGDVEVSQDDLDSIKRGASEASSGQNAGGIVGLSAGVKFQALSFSPRDLALDEARRKPEERICSLFNLPPVVVGLGAGLDKSTYNNAEAAHQAAWKNCIIPLQDYIAQVLTAKLLPMFPASAGKVVYWDRSQVGMLQPDINAARKEAREDLKAGIITIEEARAEGGREGTPTEGVLQAPQSAPIVSPDAKAFKRGTSNIYRVADAFRAALMDNEQEALLQLASAYNGVSRSIQKDIQDILVALEAAPDSERYLLAIERANALSEQVEAAMVDFADRGAAIVGDSQRTAIATTLSQSEALTRAALGTPPPGINLTFNRLPAEALEVMVGMAGNGSPLATVLETAGREFAKDLRELLVTGIAQGVNPKEVGRRMAGASGTSRARMEAIARTEMLRASREASRRSYEANPDIISGYIRLSAADTRTCAACWALHGTKSPTSERFPSHVSCRCSIVPDVKSYAEILGDPSIPDTRQVIPSGESLFASLSASDQQTILGPALFDLYKGGASLTDFVIRSYDAQWGPTLSVSNVASAAARAEIHR